MTDKRSRRELLGLLGTGAVALSGCAGILGEESEDVEVEDDAAWRTTTLEDVTTGEEFTINEFDRPVFIHPFGEWCSKCRSQQRDFQDLHERIGDRIEIVDISIVEGDGADLIRSHAEDNGFGWKFAVSPEDVTASLVDDFGTDVTSPPSSPVILLCPDGSARSIPKGASASDLEDELETNCEWE
jgi:thiol-disulfide isomerase/thioredoxin